MSSRPSLRQRRRQVRHQRQVPGRQRRHADDVHVVLHRLPRRLVGRGEQRPDVDVEAEVGERARRSPSARGRGRPGPSWRPGCAAAGRRCFGERRRTCAARAPRPCSWRPPPPCRRPRWRAISARCRPHTFSSASEISPTVALARAAATASSSRLPSPVCAASVSASSAAATAFASRSPLRRCSLAIWLSRTRLVVDLQHLDLGLVGDLELVDADDGLRAGVDARLRAGRGLLDAHLGNAGGDRLGHAAQLLDLGDVRLRLARQLVGQPLDVVAAAPRIDDAAGAASPAG